jgi:hypothetical protein
MNKQAELIEGSARDHGKSQFFTPPKLAQKLVEWAGVSPFMKGPRITRVLEPSAGNGAIVRPLVAAGAEVFIVEIDQRYVTDLIGAGATGYTTGRDFLTVEPDEYRPVGHFDLVVGNFPFHADLRGEFTLHALKFAPRIVAIYPSNVFYSERRIAMWGAVRPTRIAHISRRPWPGATDYVALELVKRDRFIGDASIVESCLTEWWTEDWA